MDDMLDKMKNFMKDAWSEYVKFYGACYKVQ